MVKSCSMEGLNQSLPTGGNDTGKSTQITAKLINQPSQTGKHKNTDDAYIYKWSYMYWQGRKLFNVALLITKRITLVHTGTSEKKFVVES